MPIRGYIKPIAFWGLLLLITGVFFRMIQPFLITVFWAVLLSMLFQNFFRVLQFRLGGRRNLAATLTMLFIVALVVLPGIFIVVALINESVGVYERIQSGQWDLTKAVDLIEAELPRLDALLRQAGLTPERLKADLMNMGLAAARAVADRLLMYSQQAMILVVQFFLMLYMLFFFLRDGRYISNRIIQSLPFGNRWERLLIARFTGVARATLRGTLVVVVVQGSMGALIFGLLGIEGAIFWGVIMTVLSILPVGGSGLVWGPAAVILALGGMWVKAVVLVLVGALGIGLIDNILRPVLVGRDTKMPDYLVLVSTLGGLGLFGLSGFVIGPVVAALLLTFWEAAGREYGGTDA
jgi:predicted PurR-regulated permease PerM